MLEDDVDMDAKLAFPRLLATSNKDREALLEEERDRTSSLRWIVDLESCLANRGLYSGLFVKNPISDLLWLRVGDARDLDMDDVDAVLATERIDSCVLVGDCACFLGTQCKLSCTRCEGEILEPVFCSNSDATTLNKCRVDMALNSDKESV